MVILDQFGRPYPAAQKAPERRPLAAAPLMDSWREYVAAGLTPERLAAILREADQGDVRRQAELFEQLLEKDAHLLGETGKRENAILNVEFTVSPATDSARDQDRRNTCPAQPHRKRRRHPQTRSVKNGHDNLRRLSIERGKQTVYYMFTFDLTCNGLYRTVSCTSCAAYAVIFDFVSDKCLT